MEGRMGSIFCSIRSMGLQLSNDTNKLIWSFNKIDGQFTAQFAYLFITSSTGDSDRSWHWKDIWRWRIPTKIKCFSWICTNNKISTWDNLMRKGWIGPNIFHLCHREAETVQHLFVHCSFGADVRRWVFYHLGLVHCSGTVELWDVIAVWIKNGDDPRYLLYFCLWVIWLCRNAWLFSGIKRSAQVTALRCLDLVVAFPFMNRKNKTKNIGLGPHCYDSSSFFDEADIAIVGGAGAVLYISSDHHFLIRLGCGLCSNSRLELLALFGYYMFPVAWAFLESRSMEIL